MKIDACIFDLDGTLLDSMWVWEAIDVEYLSKFNIHTNEKIEMLIEGKSFSESAVFFKEYFKLEDDVETIKKDWLDMARHKYRYDVKLKKGALELLNYLRDNDIKIGIATSSAADLVKLCLTELKVIDRFNTIVTSCEVAHGKPFPDVYLKAASQLNIDPVNSLCFEDIPAGIKAGKSAGMRVVAVEDDFSKHLKEYKKEISDYFVNNLDEAISIIHNNNLKYKF